MRTIALRAAIPVLLLLIIFMVLRACSHKDPLPQGRGVFYQRTAREFVALLKGDELEMSSRAIPVGSNVRPSFVINLPDRQMALEVIHRGSDEEHTAYRVKPTNVKMSDVRIAVNLADGSSGPFQWVDVIAVPVAGQEGAFRLRPNIDLPRGLCAVVVGSDDQLVEDRNNVYPFSVAGNEESG